MGVTIHEVAREAGVSTSTVSNVLNGRTEKMRPETRDRVEAAIRELHYHPSRAARRLRSGGIHTLGLVVPSVSNPFWGSFASLFEAAALAQGYGVLLCNSQRNMERERTYLEELRNDGVSGVALGSSLPSARHLAPLIESGMRIVTLDRSSQASDPAGLTDISVDNRAGGALIGEHLWAKGHRHIAFVSGEAPTISRKERLEGFLEALSRHGISRRDICLWPRGKSGKSIDGDFAEAGRKAAREIMRASKGKVTAIATVNDLLAIGAYRGLRDEGLSVGSDVAVVGFDDILLAGIIQPTLTTVHQPLDEMAEIAVSRLVHMISSPGDPPIDSLRLATRLVERESSAFQLR